MFALVLFAGDCQQVADLLTMRDANRGCARLKLNLETPIGYVVTTYKAATHWLYLRCLFSVFLNHLLILVQLSITSRDLSKIVSNSVNTTKNILPDSSMGVSCSFKST